MRRGMSCRPYTLPIVIWQHILQCRKRKITITITITITIMDTVTDTDTDTDMETRMTAMIIMMASMLRILTGLVMIAWI
jgi:hypothetical protein